MNTYREIIYMVLDKLRLVSDDSSFTEDHIIFLIDKFRAVLLKQKYSDIRKAIPESNYSTICLDLEQVPSITGSPCDNGVYLRTVNKIPNIMKIGNPRVYPLDYYQGNIAYISRERMIYTGHNKYLKNIIYTSLNTDNHLYFKSSNPQFLYLEKVKMTAVFENAGAASELNCDNNENSCDILNREFPLEEGLVAPLIEMTVETLLQSIYRPEDENNNAKDDLANKISK